MANAYILNQFPTTYGAAMSQIVEMLVRAGWTYQASGDGLAGYNATGKVFASTGSGALGWNNAKAWARLRDPGGGRELVFQLDTSGGTRFKYSPAARFVGGAPSATVTPSATDEKYLRGGGTDAAPTYGASFFGAVAGGLVVFQGCAKDTAPYGFWVAHAVTPAGLASMAFMMDPVTGAAEDPDPVAFYIHGSGTGSNAFRTTSFAGNFSADPAPGGASAGCFCFWDLARTQFLYCYPSYYTVGYNTNGGDQIGSGGAGTDTWGTLGNGLKENPFNGRLEMLPSAYMRPTIRATARGVKGWSTMVRWTTMSRLCFLDTLDNKNWIAVGNVWLPWDGVTTPVN